MRARTPIVLVTAVLSLAVAIPALAGPGHPRRQHGHASLSILGITIGGGTGLLGRGGPPTTPPTPSTPAASGGTPSTGAGGAPPTSPPTGSGSRVTGAPGAVSGVAGSVLPSGGAPAGSDGTDPASRAPVGSPGATVPAPVAGKRVDIAPAGGTVTIQTPASTSPAALAGAASVPVGSVIDVTNGVVTLVSSRGPGSPPQGARFWGGAFRVRQAAGSHPVTELELVGGSFTSCAAAGRRARLARAGHRAHPRTRLLWGSDNHGAFRTRGRNGAATVRGTVWLTQDRCDGTFFTVRAGAIAVRDYARGRLVDVAAGQSYLASSRR